MFGGSQFPLVSLIVILLTTLSNVVGSPTNAAGGLRPAAARQATREQVVRRARYREIIGKRQSQPSNGVYPLCAGSQPAGAGTLYALALGVQNVKNSGDSEQDISANSASDCKTACENRPSCAVSTFVESTEICQIFGNWGTFVLNSGYDTTATERSCDQFQTITGGQPLSCCEDWQGP